MSISWTTVGRRAARGRGLCLLLAALVATLVPALGHAPAATAAGPDASRSVTASWMPHATLTTGARRAVTGRVASSSGAPQGDVVVEVQQREHNGTWRTAARARTDATGDYSASVPTHFFHAGRWRVRVPASDGYPTATSASQGSQRVVPSYRPAGAARSFGLWGPHWDSCRPIRYRLNLSGHYRFAQREARRGFAQIGRATGLRFVYRGTTRHVPEGRSSTNPPRPADADIVMAWARPRQTQIALGRALGVARITMWDNRYTNGTSRQSISDGSIVLNRALRSFGSTNRRVWASTMLHELSHAVGLDHVQDRRQVMNPTVSTTNPLTRLSAGDLRGLNRVGAQAGCFAYAPSANRPTSARVVSGDGPAPGGPVVLTTRH